MMFEEMVSLTMFLALNRARLQFHLAPGAESILDAALIFSRPETR